MVPHKERQDMIRCLRDIYVFPGLFSAFRAGCTGLDCARMYETGILHRLSGTQISVSTEGAHGSCGSRSALGLSGYGLIGHVGHIRKGESICSCDGGLFLSMDGSMSIARQDSVVSGGCFLPKHCLPFRNAQCDSFGPRPGI